jgi:hypothetical protein
MWLISRRYLEHMGDANESEIVIAEKYTLIFQFLTVLFWFYTFLFAHCIRATETNIPCVILSFYRFIKLIWEYILFRNAEDCGTGSASGISSLQIGTILLPFNSKNSVPEFGPRSHPHALLCDHRLVPNMREQFRYGIPGIGWNWFRGRNWYRNVQHRGIGWLLTDINYFILLRRAWVDRCPFYLYRDYASKKMNLLIL